MKKRSLAESGESSKPKKSRGRDPLDTLRFLPLDDGPMITRYLVECYTRQFGQVQLISRIFLFIYTNICINVVMR